MVVQRKVLRDRRQGYGSCRPQGAMIASVMRHSIICLMLTIGGQSTRIKPGYVDWCHFCLDGVFSLGGRARGWAAFPRRHTGAGIRKRGWHATEVHSEMGFPDRQSGSGLFARSGYSRCLLQAPLTYLSTGSETSVIKALEDASQRWEKRAPLASTLRLAAQRPRP